MEHARATLAAFAVRCGQGGDPHTAAMLFGAAWPAGAAQRHRSGILDGYWTMHQTAVRGHLGDVGFDAAYAEGAELDLDEAVGLALTVEHPDLAVGTGRFG